MADGITTTRGEFDRFWDETLGDDWYIDDWDVPEDEWHIPDMPADTAFTFTFLGLGWQGTKDPTPTPWITARDLAGEIDVVSLFRRWRAASDPTVAHFHVKVPAEHVAAFQAFTKSIDATVTGGPTC